MLGYPQARTWFGGRRSARWATLLATAATGLIWAPACLADDIYAGYTSKAGASLEAFVLRTDEAGLEPLAAVVAWEADCSDGSVLPFSGELRVSAQTTGFGSPAGTLVLDSNQSGQFAAHADINGPRADGSTLISSTKVSGTLGPASATGILSAQATIQPPGGAPPVTCSTGDITWSTFNNKFWFGGITGQGEPVVAHYSRTRLRDFIFGWDTRSCSREGPFRFGDWLTNLPLRVNRRFTQRYTRDDGVSIYRYSLRVSVGSGRVNGSFAIVWTRTFSNGTPPRTCSTGAVRFRAISA